MSPFEELSDRTAARGQDDRVAAPPRVSLLAAVALIAAIVGILALDALAGQRLLAIWAAVALCGWMFVAGAARASSD
ncbi:hypothetical protein [Methylosinus sp. Sm6]|uniref:hypothetical protein n=1 Tax=Methylosinus sp. Sm6 TaxID=2866948 RepID=UPI001C997597|nr:hypothetical protein [Methylosinus sp. Sm6]MBY6239671.1 hypothetical protein [Methylosinus sp. Sm6]